MAKLSFSCLATALLSVSNYAFSGRLTKLWTLKKTNQSPTPPKKQWASDGTPRRPMHLDRTAFFFFYSELPKEAQRAFKFRKKKKANFTVIKNRNITSYKRGITRYIHNFSCLLCPCRQVLKIPGFNSVNSNFQMTANLLDALWSLRNTSDVSLSRGLAARSAPHVHALSSPSDRLPAHACCTSRFHLSFFVGQL